MKKVFFLFLILFVSYPNTTAQAQTGYAAGWEGTFLKTTNWGLNWTVQTIGPTGSLFWSVYFSDINTGTVVGDLYDNSLILRTTDGGLNWADQSSGGALTLKSVFFVDENTGFAAGSDNWRFQGVVLRTSDGGNFWMTQEIPATQTLWAVYFLDANTGFLGGRAVHGMIWRTTNSGINWTLRLNTTHTSILAFCFVSSSIGYAVGGQGDIYKTTDSGFNWTPQNSSTTLELFGVQFINAATGVTSGFGDQSGANIMRTTNGGSEWFRLPPTCSNWFYDVSFASSSTGMMVGTDGKMLRTTNEGSSWDSIPRVTTAHLTGVCFPNSHIGVRNNNRVVKDFSIKQNYPNPFNPTTTIEFDLPKKSFVSLIVYDVNGRAVNELVNSRLNAGSYNVDFNGTGLASGVYYYKIIAGDYTQTRKMVLVK